jgi:hypothetical protein
MLTQFRKSSAAISSLVGFAIFCDMLGFPNNFLFHKKQDAQAIPQR